MSSISNKQARNYVERMEIFKTSNGTIWSDHNLVANTYTVYSYGEHFPMYVYDYSTGEWYGNKDRYYMGGKPSVTTSRHQSMTRPHNVAGWYDTATMQRISLHGLTGALAHRLAA
jgi:hypothetical protein